jgi:hypothetical protein
LGYAAQHDPFWGIRAESLKALGKTGGVDAEKEIMAALNDDKPWIRKVAVQQLGHFPSDTSLGSKLTEIASTDKAYSVRAAALNAIGEIKAPQAYETLTAAVKIASPDDAIRNGAIEGLGSLGDDRAVPALLEWSAPGKDFETRGVAIESVAELDLKNTAITRALISYLKEPYTDVKFPTLIALGRRGDPAAIGPLEALVKSGELNLGDAPFVEMQIQALKAKGAGSSASPSASNANTNGNANTSGNASASTNQQSATPAAAQIENQSQSTSTGNNQEMTLAALKKLQQQMAEIDTRLGKIETQLSTTQK